MTSYIMERHQKNAGANGLILYYLGQTFRFPRDFEMLCYVSQLLQAEAIRYGVEHFRRNRSRCMGTLYWQLNDCWPVLSWSSIDYFGRWKALHYAAKRFYEPVLVSVEEDETRARIHVTNDTTQPVQVELMWSLERLDGTKVLQDTIKSEVGPESDVVLAKLDLTGELQGDAVRQTVLVHELLIGGKRRALGMTPFTPSKHLELTDARLTLKVGSDDTGHFVDVTTDKAARFVCLSVPGRDLVFSDNYFDIPAGRTVRVRADVPLDGVTAHSLKDSYS
jgi:beta-mannosidase